MEKEVVKVIVAIVLIVVAIVAIVVCCIVIPKNKKKKEIEKEKEKGGGLQMEKDENGCISEFGITEDILRILSVDFLNETFDELEFRQMYNFLMKSYENKPEKTKCYEIFAKAVNLLIEAIVSKESRKILNERLKRIILFVNDEVYRNSLEMTKELKDLENRLKEITDKSKEYNLIDEIENIGNESLKNTYKSYLQRIASAKAILHDSIPFCKQPKSISDTTIISNNTYLLEKYYDVIGITKEEYDRVINYDLKIDKKYMSNGWCTVICQCYPSKQDSEYSNKRYVPIIKYKDLRLLIRKWYDNVTYEKTLGKKPYIEPDDTRIYNKIEKKDNGKKTEDVKNKDDAETLDEHADVVPACVALDMLFALCVRYHSMNIEDNEENHERMIKVLRSYLCNIWFIDCMANALESPHTNKAFGSSFFFIE